MLLARDAVLQHLQRGEELAAEHVLAPPGIGLRRQHADARRAAACSRRKSVSRPQIASTHRGLHAELPLDRVERRAVLLEQRLALRREPRECELSRT